MLSKDLFKVIVDNTPLVSIDLIIKNSNSNVLLGKRKNSPAKGYWFVPGGRIFKNETIEKAFNRITNSELGMPLALSQAKFLGQFEHFYNDSIFGQEISTHYIVLAYEVLLHKKFLNFPLDQHLDFNWFLSEDLLFKDSVHNYTKAYFR